LRPSYADASSHRDQEPGVRSADRSRRDDLRRLSMIRPTYDPNKEIQFELIAAHALMPRRDGSPSLTSSTQKNQKKPQFPPVGASFFVRGMRVCNAAIEIYLPGNRKRGRPGH
jgi:hypothetical protein